MLRLNGYILSRLMAARLLWTTLDAGASFSVPREQGALQLAKRSPLMLTSLKVMNGFGAEGESLKDLRIAAGISKQPILTYLVSC